MLYLSHLPYALLNNILLLGLLWILFKFIENTWEIAVKKLFYLALTFQFLATFLFVVNVFSKDILPSNIMDFVTLKFLSIHENSLLLLITIYIIGLLVYMIQFVIQIISIQTLKSSGNYESHNEWIHFLEVAQIPIPKNVKIGLSDKVNTPIVFGILEPIILLPFSICNDLSTEEIKLILAHEIAHILRNDYLVNLLINITKIILWFNPFSYLFIKSLNRLREMACDAYVVSKYNAPLTYSKALYKLASASSYEHLNFALGAVINKEHELMVRIQKINQIPPTVTKRFSNIKTTIVLTVCSFILLQFLSPQAKMLNNTVISKKMNLIQHANNSIMAHVSKHDQVHKVKTNTHKKSLHRSFTPLNNSEHDLAINNDKENLNTPHTNYDALIMETKNWIKQHESPIQNVSYSNEIDSIDNLLAERLLMSSIIKSYQLKRAIISQKLAKAQDQNEAIDYVLNSKEWSDIVEYEKWAKEYLVRHQQNMSLPSTNTKQQIQYR